MTKCLVATLLITLFIASAAGLAVMSVDMGTEFMKIAIVKPGVPMEIAINKESRRKTPVIVSLVNGERVFGDAALSKGQKYPKKTYWFLLDLLGKKVDSPQVALFKQRFPYYDIEEDPVTGMTVFIHDEETKYTVEELVAMILCYAKETAEAFTEQPISEAVITVPMYFNQAERRAMIRAAELADIKVLQLINDYSAVALNYGVFRRKTFDATPVNYLFFDSGSGSTSAAIVSYQLIKGKSGSTSVEEVYPQVTVKGVGYDRTLGGVEFQLRLRDHLAKQFNNLKKTSTDVTQDTRAMQKLFKEAGRLKQVLSANNDHYAQVESLVDDIDFRVKVSRTDFESMCSDLFDRVAKVVKDALDTSEMTRAELAEVILMGGGTRVPKIQEMLQTAIGRNELGKSINTDEAAALGGVYLAAYLSKGFKVKRFNIKEASMFPIQATFPSFADATLEPGDPVEFERVKAKEDGSETSKLVKRTLFGRMNPYPQKKVMTFNKHTKDFGFVVNYGNLDFLSKDELEAFGNTHLHQVALSGIEAANEKHVDKAEAKGVKAHFRMDDSGILHLDKVESLFEKVDTAAEEEEKKEEESAFSKFGSTLSNLFGGGKDKEADKEGSVEDGKDEPPEASDNSKDSETVTKEEQQKDAESSKDGQRGEQQKDQEEVTKEESIKDGEKEEEKKTEKESKQNGKEETTEKEEVKPEEKTEEKVDEKPDAKAEETTEADKKAKESEKDKDGEKKEKEEEDKKQPKAYVVKEEIKVETEIVDMKDPGKDHVAASRKKIADLKKRDKEKAMLEKARNELESFVFDAQDKLYQESYETCSTQDERDTLLRLMGEASEWLDETDDTTERKAYEAKLKELKKATKSLYVRVKEREERPTALDALNGIVNYTQHFLHGMKNLTGDDLPFTDVELETLDKLIKDTLDWNKTVTEEQNNLPAHDDPKLTVEDIARKIGDLDREVKYLINKAKTFRPKPKAKPKVNKTEEATPSNDTKTDTGTEEEKQQPTVEAVEDDEDGQVENEGEEQEEESKQEEETLKLESSPSPASSSSSSSSSEPSSESKDASVDHVEATPVKDSKNAGHGHAPDDL